MKTVSDEVFNELLREAAIIWQTYDNSHGYVDEKMERLNKLQNYSDNWGTIVGMMDIHNQRKLYDAVGEEARQAIDDWVGGLATREAEARMMGLL